MPKRDIVQPSQSSPPDSITSLRGAHAVIVGVNRYADPRIRDLSYARADAEELAAILCDPGLGGFLEENVTLLVDEDATRRSIVSAVGTHLSRSASPDDLVCVFFAGHGATDPDPSRQSLDGLAKYLLPHDADLDDLFSSAVPMQDVERFFSRIAARQIIFFLDACYSGGADTFATRSVLTPDFLHRLAEGGEGRLVMTSCRPNEVSLEDARFGGGHGLYSHYLLKGLRGEADAGGDGLVTLDELYDYLHKNVSAHARRVGGSMSPIRTGTAQGDIFLTAFRTDAQKEVDRFLEVAAAARQVDDLAGARAAALQALDVDPGHTEAQEVLASVDATLGRWHTALVDLNRQGLLPDEALEGSLALLRQPPGELPQPESFFRNKVVRLAEKDISPEVFLDIWSTRRSPGPGASPADDPRESVPAQDAPEAVDMEELELSTAVEGSEETAKGESVEEDAEEAAPAAEQAPPEAPAQEEPAPAARAPRPRRRRAIRWRRWLAYAAAATVVLVAAGKLWEYRNDREEAARVIQQVTEGSQLALTEGRERSIAFAFAALRQGTDDLAVQALRDALAAPRMVAEWGTYPRGVVASPQGGRFAAVDSVARVWSLDPFGEERAFWHADYQREGFVSWSPDGQRLISGSGSGDGAARLWDVNTGTELARLQHEGGIAWTVLDGAFSPDERVIATVGIGVREGGGLFGDPVLWDGQGRNPRKLLGHTGYQSMARFSPDGSVLATAGDEGTTILWSIPDGRLLHRLPSSGQVESVRFSPDGSVVATVGAAGATLWSVSTGSALHRLAGLSDTVIDAWFTPDGKTLVTGGMEGVHVWSVSSGDQLRVLSTERADHVRVSPDGAMVVGAQDPIHVWALGTGAQIATLGRTAEFGVNAVDFSPDGRYLLATHYYHGRVWSFMDLSYRQRVAAASPEELLEMARQAMATFLTPMDLTGQRGLSDEALADLRGER